MPPKIKNPPSYDISHWKEVVDFKLVSPRPAFFWTKATEAAPNTGYNHTDSKFIRFFKGMMEIGCIRGAYHFHRKTVDPRKQAKHFVNVISNVDILKTDRLILDIEEGGEKTSQLWAWLEFVKSAYPENQLMIYSRKNILDRIVMTYAEREYFKKIKIITAGYPYFPDLFSSVPTGYIPDQTKYGKVALWQYSEKGIVEGIKGSVDLNWIEPEFYSTLGDNTMAEEIINFTGKCTNTDNKVWDFIGGEVQGAVKPLYAPVSGDKRSTINGILYLHLKSPIVGWTKKQWFDVVFESAPPPPPPTPSVSHTIDVFSDGKISVDNGSPY